ILRHLGYSSVRAVVRSPVAVVAGYLVAVAVAFVAVPFGKAVSVPVAASRGVACPVVASLAAFAAVALLAAYPAADLEVAFLEVDRLVVRLVAAAVMVDR